jgi:hypothetical protein
MERTQFGFAPVKAVRIFFLGLVLSFWGMSLVCARTWFVTPNALVVTVASGASTASVGTSWAVPVRLWEAIQYSAAGDVILMKSGDYKESGSPTAEHTSYRISKTLTIKGGYKGTDTESLDSGFPFSRIYSPLGGRVMAVAKCTVELRNLIFSGGDASKEATYSLAGASIPTAVGGALCIAAGTTAKLHNTKFVQNIASSNAWGSGGGVAVTDWENRNTSSLPVTYSVNVTFSGNTVFEGNTAGNNVQKEVGMSTGGGISIMAGTSVSFEGNVLFKDNVAFIGDDAGGGRGGAIVAEWKTELSFDNVTSLRFEGNVASIGNMSGYGGAIWSDGVTFSIPAVANAVFTGNLASMNGEGMGGALYLLASKLQTQETLYTLRNVCFENNIAVYGPNATSKAWGGAIYLTGNAYATNVYTASKLTLSGGSSLSGNVASKGRGSDAKGGAVYVDNANRYRGSASKLVIEDAVIFGNIASDNPNAQQAIYHGGGVFSTNNTGLSIPNNTVPAIYDNLPCTLDDHTCYGEYNVYPDITCTICLDEKARQRYSLSSAAGASGRKYYRVDFLSGVQFPSFYLTPLSDNVIARPTVNVYPLSQWFDTQVTPIISLATTTPSEQMNALYQYNGATLTQDILLWPVGSSTVCFEKSNVVTFTPNYPTTHTGGVALSLGESIDFSVTIPASHSKFGTHVGIFKAGVLQGTLTPFQQEGNIYYYRYEFNLQNAEDVTLRHYFDCLTIQLPPAGDPAYGTQYIEYPSSSEFPRGDPPGDPPVTYTPEYPYQPSPARIYYRAPGESFAVIVRNTNPTPPVFFQLLLEDFHTLSQVEQLDAGLYRFSFTVPDWHDTKLFANSMLKLKFIESSAEDCLASSFFQKNGQNASSFFTLTLTRFPQGIAPVDGFSLGDIRPPTSSPDTTYYFSPYPSGLVTVDLEVYVPARASLPHVSANLVPLTHSALVRAEEDTYVYTFSFRKNTILFVNQEEQRTVHLPPLPGFDAPILYYHSNSAFKEGYYTDIKGQSSRGFAFSWGNFQAMGGLIPQIITARWDEQSQKVIQDTIQPLSILNCNVQINSDALLHFRTKAYHVLTFPALPEGVAYTEEFEEGKFVYPNTEENCVDIFGIITSGRYRYVTPTVSISSPSPATIDSVTRDDEPSLYTYWYKFTATNSADISIAFNYETIKLPTPNQLPETVRYADLNEQGGEYFHSSDHPFTFSLNLSEIPSEKGVRVVFIRDVSGERDTVPAVSVSEKITSFTLYKINSGSFNIYFSSDTVILPLTLPEGLSYDPSSNLKAGRYTFPVGETFLDTLTLNLASSHVGLLPLVTVNGLMIEPYEVIDAMIFRYKIQAQGRNADVRIGLPNYKITLLTDGKPDDVTFADAPNGRVYYCIPGSTFTFDLLVSESAGDVIPAVTSTGTQMPHFSGRVGSGRYRYVINGLSGHAVITISGLISGQIVLPLPNQLPEGLAYFSGKEGDAYLSGGVYTYPVAQSVKDSFALLISKRYRQVEPIVSSSSGLVTLVKSTDSTRVYRIDTPPLIEIEGYKVSVSVKFPPLSSIELPVPPDGVFYVNDFEPGTWYCVADQNAVFSFSVCLDEVHKNARLLVLQGGTPFKGKSIDGTILYTFPGGENINNLSFKMEYYRLVLPDKLSTGLTYGTGNAPNGKPLFTAGEYILTPEQMEVYFAIKVNRAQVIGDDPPVVKTNDGVPLVPLSSESSGENQITYFFSCLTQGTGSSQISISIPFYRVTLNPIDPNLANMLAFANGSEPEIGELLAGEPYEFYLRLKPPYTEMEIIVEIDGDTIPPVPQGNHVYRFTFIVDNNITPNISLRYSCVTLSALPDGIFYVGTRSNQVPLYHQYTDWKDSFSVKVLPDYAHVRPLVKTSFNTILQPSSVTNGDTYTYVFSGTGDMSVTTSLPYKTITFPVLPEGLTYMEPVTAGSSRFSANSSFSFALQTSEIYAKAVPLVTAGQIIITDEDANPNDNIYLYSHLAEVDLTLSINLTYRQFTYLPIDPVLRPFIKYDVSRRDSGVYRFSPSIATQMDTFAIIRNEEAMGNIPFNIKATVSNGATLQEVAGKPYTYAVISTVNTEISVTVDKFTVTLPALPEGLVYDQPPSNIPSDYPKQAGNYSRFPSQHFSFTLRPTGGFTSLIPVVTVNGNTLSPAAYSGNRYEYSFTVTSSVTPNIQMPATVSCTLSSLSEGFAYVSGGPNKTAGVWAHISGIPFRDTFELAIDPNFANVKYAVTAASSTSSETLSPTPGSKQYIVYGDGTKNITVSLVASYNIIVLPDLSSTPQLHYAEGSPANNAIHRHPPGVEFAFTIQRDAGVHAIPVAELTGVTVTRTEISTDVFRFSFTIPANAAQDLTYSPVISLPPVYTLTLPSVLPHGVLYASDSPGSGVHFFSQDADISFTLQTESGLDDIHPIVTRSDGSTISSTALTDSKYLFNCGKNQNVELQSVVMNVFTVIINPPPSNVVVAPPTGIYNSHTDFLFNFTVTPPPDLPTLKLVVKSNNVLLSPDDILENGGYTFSIGAEAAYDTFYVDITLQSIVSNQPSFEVGVTPLAVYRDGCLQLGGMNGYHFSLISLTGVTIARFSTTEQVAPSLVPEADYWLYPVTLPPGVYILYAEKERKRPMAVKFIVP